MKTIFHYFRISLFLFILLTILTGVMYPAFITGIAQWAFANQANGSMTSQGSLLIQQPFNQPNYFWGRPSATTPFPDNAASSAASSFGPTNPALIAAVKTRIALLKKVDPTNTLPIPVDLVTTSGSGLDPEISPAAAYYQAPRIAKLRNLPLWQVTDLITANIRPRQLDLLGEPRVNVLQLNIALDQISQKS